MYRIRIEKILPGNVEDAEKILNGDIENKIEPKQVGWIDGFDFSIFMQNLLVSEDGYIMDTGNWANANYICAYRLLNKIKRHPWIWRLLFMVG